MEPWGAPGGDGAPFGSKNKNNVCLCLWDGALEFPYLSFCATRSIRDAILHPCGFWKDPQVQLFGIGFNNMSKSAGGCFEITRFVVLFRCQNEIPEYGKSEVFAPCLLFNRFKLVTKPNKQLNVFDYVLSFVVLVLHQVLNGFGIDFGSRREAFWLNFTILFVIDSLFNFGWYSLID